MPTPRQPSRRAAGGALTLALLAALAAAPLSAQPMPDRPRLPAAADTNDWEAYYDYGASLLRQDPRRAEAAMRWAARLDPTRAEPHYAEVYLQLGVAFEAAGMPAEARTAYGEFVRRAPRRSPALAQVRQRLQQLGGG